MRPKIKIIDLFAGPGGLGEGFSAYETPSAERPYSIIASVEREASAHKTLQLRAFFRKFQRGEVPKEYYQYVRGEIAREDLYSHYPSQSKLAIKETLFGPQALGQNNRYIEDKIIEHLGKRNSPTVVIGGPPCQAYSLVGRARNMGNSSYVAKEDHRHFLYKEYLNILNLVEPDAFVMENVKGILSTTMDGEKMFPKILDDLKNPSIALGKRGGSEYSIYSLVFDNENTNDEFDNKNYIIKSELYGVPQARHRVILLGVRNDIKRRPSVLKPDSEVTVENIIAGLPMLRSGLSKEDDSLWFDVVKDILNDLPKLLKYEDQYEIARYIKSLKDQVNPNLSRGARFVEANAVVDNIPYRLRRWVRDDKIKGVLNHETRGHIRSDLERYLYCSVFAIVNGNRDNPTPKAKEFPTFLAPNHQNWESGKFADRFRVQIRNKYATTITSHISKDGHYFIHYDPLQCRSLTVREAARIQTFPDNYFFEGNRTQQYVQVGNAVPPYLANKIANLVYNLLS